MPHRCSHNAATVEILGVEILVWPCHVKLSLRNAIAEHQRDGLLCLWSRSPLLFGSARNLMCGRLIVGMHVLHLK